MAKRDIKNGKVYHRVDRYRKYNLEMQFRGMYREESRKKKATNPERTSGPREIILSAYKKNEDKADAYEAMKNINKVFTKERVDNWIQEYDANSEEKWEIQERIRALILDGKSKSEIISILIKEFSKSTLKDFFDKYVQHNLDKKTKKYPSGEGIENEL